MKLVSRPLHRSTLIVRVVHRGELFRTFRFREDMVTIGSGDDCGIQIRGSEEVAPIHARIMVTGDQVMLIPELGESVQVNGQTVQIAHLTRDDVVSIASFRFTVEQPRASGRPVPPSPPPVLDELEDMPTARHVAFSEDESPTMLARPLQLRSYSAREDEDEGSIESEDDDSIALEDFVESEDDDSVALEDFVEGEDDDSVALEDATEDKELNDDSDDDDDELSFVPPFNLAEILAAAPDEVEGPKARYCAAELVRLIDDRIVEVVQVTPGTPYHTLDGALSCTASRSGVLLRRSDEFEVISEEAAGSTIELKAGERITLQTAKATWQVRAYLPPHIPLSRRLLRPAALVPVVLAAIIHVVIATGSGLMPTAEIAGVEETEERFAEVTMEKPKPEVIEAAPPPTAPTTATGMAERIPTVSTAQIQQGAETARSVSELVEALQSAPATTSITGAIAATSPLAPAGASDFNLSGAIAALGDGPKAERGSSVIATRGGSAALDGLETRLAAREGEGSGQVRAQVTRVASAAEVQGQLDKAEISRVVNGSMRRIQTCYERTLMSEPGIGGRVVFDWVVTPQGSVKSVRVRSSTLGNATVEDCIMQIIRGWNFAAPEGGKVTVTYPFLFRSVSQ